MMKRVKTRSWPVTWAVLPMLAGSLTVGCDDDDDTVMVDTGVPPDAAPPVDTAPGMDMAPLPDGAPPVDTAPMADAPASCPTTPEGMLVTADVTASTTWNCPVYTLKQKVYVQGGAILTIAAGTKVLADAAAAGPALIVTRGSQLVAKGTAAAPIVFTSGNPVGARMGGDWAGVALLGSALINTGTPCAAGGANCRESILEGLPETDPRSKFGGIDDASSCGELEYVRIEFAGEEIAPNNELNGLTLGGCGAGTKLSYIQVHRGTDDGIEFFGGTANMHHVVLSANEDDSLDWDFGWTGKVQHLVLHQRSNAGDYGIEGAGSPQGETLAPLTNPTIYNMTAVSTNPSGKAIILKEGSLGKIYNSIIQNFAADCVDFRSAEVNYATLWPTMTTIENTLFWMCNYVDEAQPNAMGQSQDDDMGFADPTAVNDPARMNSIAIDPMLPALPTLVAPGEPRPSWIPANAAGVTTGAATPPMDGFFQPAPYKGAFAPGGPDWTAGWTDYPIN